MGGSIWLPCALLGALAGSTWLPYALLGALAGSIWLPCALLGALAGSIWLPCALLGDLAGSILGALVAPGRTGCIDLVANLCPNDSISKQNND